MKPSTLASGACPARRSHHLTRVQQFQVECGRQVRVVQPRIARPHGVLVATEQRQPLLNEGPQGLQRLHARDGPRKAVQPAGVECEAGVDERDHLARDGIGLERRTPRHGARAGCAEGLTVVGVEVPLAADGLIVLPIAFHQHVVTLALLAIEVLHAQRLAVLGMRSEVANAAEEVTVLANLQRQVAGLGHGLDRLQHAPFARGGHLEAGWLQAQDVGLQLRTQSAEIAIGIQAGVVQRAAGGLQGEREMAHRRQEHHGARLARPHMGRLLGHFGHPHGVDARIETVEGRCIEVELIAQHDDQGTQLSHAQPCCVGRRRSSTSRRPSSLPSDAASSSPGRNPRRACLAMRPCCRESRRRAQSP